MIPPHRASQEPASTDAMAAAEAASVVDTLSPEERYARKEVIKSDLFHPSSKTRRKSMLTAPSIMQREILFLRHKLQKDLVPRSGGIDPERMPSVSQHLRKLEDAGRIEPDILQSTKVHKVLRYIIKYERKPWGMGPIPRDAEFRIIERARTLLAQYDSILASQIQGDVMNRVSAKLQLAEGKIPTGTDVTENEKRDIPELPETPKPVTSTGWTKIDLPSEKAAVPTPPAANTVAISPPIVRRPDYHHVTTVEDMWVWIEKDAPYDPLADLVITPHPGWLDGTVTPPAAFFLLQEVGEKMDITTGAAEVSRQGK